MFVVVYISGLRALSIAMSEDGAYLELLMYVGAHTSCQFLFIKIFQML